MGKIKPKKEIVEANRKMERIQRATKIIQQASDHPGCSSGQLVLADFIRSCLDYDNKVSMKEVLYSLDASEIKDILDLAQCNSLKGLVETVNPHLLNRKG